MLKYNYKYIVTWVVVIALLAVAFYQLFPLKSPAYLLFFLFPILIVLWRYLNFVEVTDDALVVTSFLRKRRFDFEDIRKIVINKDNSLYKGTLEMTVYGDHQSFHVFFGNLKYSQAKQIKRLIGTKTNVVVI